MGLSCSSGFDFMPGYYRISWETSSGRGVNSSTVCQAGPTRFRVQPKIPATNDRTAFSSILWGHTVVELLLLEKGADAEATNSYGETALSRASKDGHLKVVELLLAKDSSMAATNRHGWIQLHEAAKNGHLDVVQLPLRRVQVSSLRTTVRGHRFHTLLSAGTRLQSSFYSTGAPSSRPKLLMARRRYRGLPPPGTSL